MEDKERIASGLQSGLPLCGDEWISNAELCEDLSLDGVVVKTPVNSTEVEALDHDLSHDCLLVLLTIGFPLKCLDVLDDESGGWILVVIVKILVSKLAMNGLSLRLLLCAVRLDQAIGLSRQQAIVQLSVGRDLGRIVRLVYGELRHCGSARVWEWRSLRGVFWMGVEEPERSVLEDEL